MYKIIGIALMMILSFKSSAESEDHSTGHYDGEVKKSLTPQEIRTSLEVDGEIFIVDSAGKLIGKGHDHRSWRFGAKGDIVSTWSFSQKGMKEFNLWQKWSITDDAKIMIDIRQYETMNAEGEKVTYGKLIREEKKEVKDFTPVSWVADSTAETKVVVRLTPQLLDDRSAIELPDMVLGLNNVVVYDNQGHLWAHIRGLEGRFIAVTTHLGLVAIGFAPFKGAKEIGTAMDNEINLDFLPDDKITFFSAQPILSLKRPVKVYGYLDKNIKTTRLLSVHVTSSDDAKDFLHSK